MSHGEGLGWGWGERQAGRGQWGEKGDIINTFNNKEVLKTKQKRKLSHCFSHHVLISEWDLSAFTGPY